MVSVDKLLVRVNKVSKKFMMFAQNLSEMRETSDKKVLRFGILRASG